MITNEKRGKMNNRICIGIHLRLKNQIIGVVVVN